MQGPAARELAYHSNRVKSKWGILMANCKTMGYAANGVCMAQAVEIIPLLRAFQSMTISSDLPWSALITLFFNKGAMNQKLSVNTVHQRAIWSGITHKKMLRVPSFRFLVDTVGERFSNSSVVVVSIHQRLLPLRRSLVPRGVCEQRTTEGLVDKGCLEYSDCFSKFSEVMV